MIDFYIENKKIVKIKVPHNIYDLFVYEDGYTYEETSTHYGMYQLTRLKEEVEDLDYDLTKEEKDFIEEVYKFCEEKFNEEPILETVIEFLDEDFE